MWPVSARRLQPRPVMDRFEPFPPSSRLLGGLLTLALLSAPCLGARAELPVADAGALAPETVARTSGSVEFCED